MAWAAGGPPQCQPLRADRTTLPEEHVSERIVKRDCRIDLGKSRGDETGPGFPAGLPGGA
jgi:hypothetical protein